MQKYQSTLRLRIFRPKYPLTSSRRQFSSCPANLAANPLIHLQAYSNTRENQWFSRSTGLPRIEFSPQLQLIRSSEGLDKTAKKQLQKLKNEGSIVSHLKHVIQGRRQRRRIKASIATFKRQRLIGQRLRASDRLAFNIGQIVLTRYEKEKQELLSKISNLEKHKKRNEKAIAALEKSHKKITAKYLRLINESNERRAGRGTTDLLLIALGVTSVTTLCLMWNRSRKANEELRTITKLKKEQQQQRHNLIPKASEPTPEPVPFPQNTETASLLQPPPAVSLSAASTASEPKTSQSRSFWNRIFWS